MNKIENSKKSKISRTWKKIKTRVVHKNPWFSVLGDDVLRPDGSRTKYYLTVRIHPGVVVIAYNGRYVYLTNQYRYSLKKRLWEFVAGRGESKSSLNQAKNELREETGLEARRWTYLGQFACAPGSSNHLGKVYLAEGLDRGQHNREAGEADMIVKKFSVAQVDRMIREGMIIDSWTITPWYFFKDYLKKSRS